MDLKSINGFKDYIMLWGKGHNILNDKKTDYNICIEMIPTL